MTTIEKIRVEIEERMHEICNTRSGRVAKRNMSEYKTLRNLLDLVNPFLGISGPTYTESCGIPTTSPKYKLDVKKDWHKENASHGAFALTQNEIDFYYKKEQPVVKKSNALFDKCVENCDPAVMKEVSDNIDKMLGRQPVEGLEEAAVNHVQSVVDAVGHPGWDWETQDVLDAFKSGAEWHAEQGETYTTEVIMLPGGIKKIQYAVEGFEPGDKVIVQIRRKI